MGYTSKWQKERAAFLALPQNRMCACGCGRIANVVDHIVAHKGEMKLFWDRSNWQPMHSSCNTRKAIASEGGFGKRNTPPGAVKNFAAVLRERCVQVKRNSSEIGGFRRNAQSNPDGDNS